MALRQQLSPTGLATLAAHTGAWSALAYVAHGIAILMARWLGWQGLAALGLEPMIAALIAVSATLAAAVAAASAERAVALSFAAGVALFGAARLLGPSSIPGVVGTSLAALALAAVHGFSVQRLAGSQPISLTVITGFLGSGKTTLLNRLLNAPDLGETAVIVNEIGEIGIDHLLVKRIDERMTLLANGCLCCTVRGDLIATLAELIERMDRREIPHLRRVFIETTGLADPVPVIAALTSTATISRRVALQNVVTCVDAVNGIATLDGHHEAVSQVTVADRLVVTKTDCAADATLSMLRARIESLNPAASTTDAVHGEVDPEILLAGPGHRLRGAAAAREWLDAGSYEPHGHDNPVGSFSITRDEPVRIEAFSRFMKLLADQHGEALLRVKGILNVEGKDRPAVIHGVRTMFFPVEWLDRWPSADRRTQLVFISKGLSRDHVKNLLEACHRDAYPTAGDGRPAPGPSQPG